MPSTIRARMTKKRKSSVHAAITGVHGYVPPDVLTNAELARMVDTNDKWIVERTGIKTRRILKGKGLGTSHMGAEAVRGLLKKTGTAPGDVDLLDLRHHNARFGVSLDRQSHLRHGRNSQHRQLRCAGRVLGLYLCADHRRAIHRDREVSQDRGGRRRQDVGDHRLYGSRHLRAVRRRRRRRAGRAEPSLRHHRHADLFGRRRHEAPASEGRRQPHAADGGNRRQASALRAPGGRRGLQVRGRPHGRSGNRADAA